MTVIVVRRTVAVGPITEMVNVQIAIHAYAQIIVKKRWTDRVEATIHDRRRSEVHGHIIATAAKR